MPYACGAEARPMARVAVIRPRITMSMRRAGPAGIVVAPVTVLAAATARRANTSIETRTWHNGFVSYKRSRPQTVQAYKWPVGEG